MRVDAVTRFLHRLAQGLVLLGVYVAVVGLVLRRLLTPRT